jgi:hypothetical protein
VSKGTVSSGVRLGSLTNAAPLYLGGPLVGSSKYFKGQFDEVEVFDRALSASEVLDLYQAELYSKCR